MITSTKDRYWLLGGGFVAIIVIAIGWLFVISPQRGQTNTLNSQTSQAQGQASTLRQNLVSLRADSANLAKYKAELAVAQQALPATSGMPDFLREMQATGSATGVSVTGISVTTAQPVGGTPAAAASSTSAGSTSTTPVVGTGQVYAAEITVTASGSVAGLTAFMQQIQQVQPRAVLVVGINEAPGAGGQLTLTANLQAFIAPGTAPSATTGN